MKHATMIMMDVVPDLKKRLEEFCDFFLQACIDQVDFMQSLLQPRELLRRMKPYCDDETAAGRLANRSMALLRDALLMEEVERGGAPEITGYQERRLERFCLHCFRKDFLYRQALNHRYVQVFPWTL